MRGKSQVNIEGLSVEFKNIYIEGKNVGANVEGKEIYVSSDGVLSVSGAKFSFEQKGNFICQDKMHFTDEAIIIGAGNSLFKAENGIDFGSVGFNLSGVSKLIVGSNSEILITNSKIQSLHDLSFIGRSLKLENNSEIVSEGSIDLKNINISIKKSGLRKTQMRPNQK